MENPRRILIMAASLVLLTALITAGIGLAWMAIGGGPLAMHGWVAMSLGIGGTIVLAWVLMALAFRSDRDGWDDRASELGDTPETPEPPPPGQPKP